jgi:hypothetical protein
MSGYGVMLCVCGFLLIVLGSQPFRIMLEIFFVLFLLCFVTDVLGSVHEFRGVLFERELIYAWDGDRTSSWNDQRSCLGAAQSSIRKG